MLPLSLKFYILVESLIMLLGYFRFATIKKWWQHDHLVYQLVISVICSTLSNRDLLIKSYFSLYCFILFIIFLSLSSSLSFNFS